MARIIIPDKICPHCGGTKWIIEYRKRPTKSDPNKRIIRYRCPKRADERTKRFFEKHGEKAKEKAKKYRKKYGKKKTLSGYWKLPKQLEKHRIKAKRESESLPNHFVRNMLVQCHNSTTNIKLSSKDISIEMIEIARKRILLTRQIRNHVKAN